MQLDSYFYVYDNLQITVDLPPLYHNGEVYLPKKMVSSLEKTLNLKSKSIHSAKTKIKKKAKKVEVKRIKQRQPSQKIKVSPAPTARVARGAQKKKQNLRIPQKSSLHFIVIDPGHGGRDPGAQGYNKISEKEITLLAGKKLARFLRGKFPRTKIILTRKSDHFISLERRGKIANRYYSGGRFGVFLSLHCNANFTPQSHGFEIYYLHRSPTNEEARLLMIRENLSFRASKNIKKFTAYLLDSQIQKESKRLAIEVHRAFTSKLKGLVSSRGIRRADFSVMRSVNMPALLIEMGYITNTREAGVLKSNLFLGKIGQAITAGIQSFLRKRPSV